MKASELRIGNYVNDSVFAICITSISEKNIIEGFTINEWDKIEIEDRRKLYMRYEFNLENLLPFSLTEEWLVKLGFKEFKDREGGLILMIGSILCLDWDAVTGMHLCVFKEDPGLTLLGLNNIEYVHQLQNLYFALTGEELEIKEKL